MKRLSALFVLVSLVNGCSAEVDRPSPSEPVVTTPSEPLEFVAQEFTSRAGLGAVQALQMAEVGAVHTVASPTGGTATFRFQGNRVDLQTPDRQAVLSIAVAPQESSDHLVGEARGGAFIMYRGEGGETRYTARAQGVGFEHLLERPPTEGAPGQEDYVVSQEISLSPGFRLDAGEDLAAGDVLETTSALFLSTSVGDGFALIDRPEVLHGGSVVPSPVRYRLERTGESQYVLETRVALAWLRDQARSYPLVIDPNIVIITGWGGEDTETSSWRPIARYWKYIRSQWIVRDDQINLPRGSVVVGVSLLGILGSQSELREGASILLDHTTADNTTSLGFESSSDEVDFFYGDFGGQGFGWYGEHNDVDQIARQNRSSTGSSDLLYVGDNLRITMAADDGVWTETYQEFAAWNDCASGSACQRVYRSDTTSAGSSASETFTDRPHVRVWAMVPEVLTIGEAFSDGSFDEAWYLNMYRFETFGVGDVTVNTTRTGGDALAGTRLWVYDWNGNVVACEAQVSGQSGVSCETPGGFANLFLDELPAGVYFVKVDEDGRDENVFYDLTVTTEAPDAPSGITAATSSTGGSINPANWQGDDDPYFAWTPPNSPDVIAGYSITHESGTVDCDIDTTTNGFQYSVAAIPNDQWSVRVRAISQAGECGPVSSPFTFWVDDHAETPTNLAFETGAGLPVSPNTWTNEAGLTFLWDSAAADAPASGFRVSRRSPTAPGLTCTGGTVLGAGADEWTPSAFSNGSWALDVLMEDVAGNCSSVASSTIKIDVGQDSVTAIEARNPANNNLIAADTWQGVSSPRFSFSASASVSPLLGYSYQFATNPDCVADVGTDPFELDGELPNGTHDLTVRAIDVAGNCGPVSSTLRLLVDATAEQPGNLRLTTTGGAGVAPSTWQREDDIRILWDDQSEHAPADTFSVALAPAAADCSPGTLVGDVAFVDRMGLSDGIHTFRVAVRDEAGNCSSAGEIAVWVDGSGASATTLQAFVQEGGATIAADTWQNDNDPYFTWTAPPVTGDQAPIDGYSVGFGSEPPCEVQTVATNYVTPPDRLTDGAHTAYVLAVDRAGNCGAPATFSLKVDATPDAFEDAPVALESIGGDELAAPPAWNSDTDPVIEWVAPSSTAEIVGYSTAWGEEPDESVDETALRITPDRGEGQHSFRIRAVDAAGNAGPMARVDFWIDSGGDGIGSVSAWLDDSKTHAITEATWQSDNDPFFDWPDTAAAGAPVIGYATAVDREPDCAVNVIASQQQFATDGLEDGAHTFYAMTVDGAGNCGDPASFDVWVDAAKDSITALDVATASGGAGIDPATWQRDNDPYFSWDALSSTGEPLTYSYALAGDPDCVAEGSASTLQTASDEYGNGKFTFGVLAIDAVGNCGDPRRFELWVDDTAEVPTGVAALTALGGSGIGDGAWTNVDRPVMTWTHVGEHAPVDGFSGGFGTPTCDVETRDRQFQPDEALSDGEYTFTVRAIDVAGNCSSDSAAFTLRVDATRDAVTSISAQVSSSDASPIPRGSWQRDADPYLSWAAPESEAPIAGYAVAWDNTPNCVVNHEGNTLETAEGRLAPGKHTFFVAAIDEAQNCGEAASFEIWVDGVGDAILSLEAVDDSGRVIGPDEWQTDNDPLFRWTASAPASPAQFSYALGGEADCTAESGATSYQVATDDLEDGTHTFEVLTVDAADNCGPVARTQVRIDTLGDELGELLVRSGPGGDPLSSGDWATAPPIFNWEAPSSTAPIVGYGVGIDSAVECGIDIAAPTLDLGGEGLAEGVHYVELMAVDAAGNCGPARRFDFRLDETPPTVGEVVFLTEAGGDVITPGTWQSDNDPYFSWSAPESTSPIAGYHVRVDGGGNCTVNQTEAFLAVSDDALADGQHEFGVLAVDEAGNCGDEVTVSFRVDATADRPSELRALTREDGAFINQRLWQPDNDPYFEWLPAVSTAPIEGYAWGLSGEPDCEVDANTTSYTVPEDTLSDGVHRFWIQAVDSAGNCGSALEYELWVMTTLPVVELTRVSPNPARADIDVSITFTVDRTLTISPNVLVDGGAASQASLVDDTYVYSYRVTGAESQDGDRPITIVVFDDAGNRGETNGTIRFDFAAPELTVDAAPGLATTGDTLSIALSAAEPLDGEPRVEVDGIGVDGLVAGDGGWTVDYLVTGAETEGPVQVSAMGDDGAGNEGVDTEVVIFDFTEPAITLLEPAERSVFDLGQTVSLVWETEEANLGTVDIHYSTDGGATYPHVIVEATADDGSYDWVVPEPETVRGQFRLVATDAVGLVGEFLTTYQFRVRDPIADHLILFTDDTTATVGEALDVQIELVDVLGAPIEEPLSVTIEVDGSAVITESSLGGGTIEGNTVTGTLDAAGRGVVTIVDRRVETVIASGRGDGMAEVQPHIDATLHFLTSGPDHLVAFADDGLAPTGGLEPVEVHLVDREGNPVADGIAVTVVATGSAVFLESTLADVSGLGTGAVSGRLGANGTAVVLVRDRVTETVTVNPGEPEPTLPGEVEHQETTVTFIEAGEISLEFSDISAAPEHVFANGVAASLITVTPADGGGDLVGTGADVVVRTTVGQVTDPVDRGDGTYTALLTSRDCPDESARVTALVDGVLLDAFAEVSFTCESVRNADFEVSPGRIPGDGETCATVTLTPLTDGDVALGNGQSVEMSATYGDLSEVEDLGDGSYRATYCADTCNDAQPALIQATINGVRLSAINGNLVGRVTVFCIAVDPVASTLTVAPTEVEADGSAAATVTVTPIDNRGESMGGGLNVAVNTSLGSATPAEDQDDGSYVARVTATSSGTALIGATVNGVALRATAEVSFFEVFEPDDESIEVTHEVVSGDPIAGGEVVLKATVRSDFPDPIDAVRLDVWADGASLVDGSVSVEGESMGAQADDEGRLSILLGEIAPYIGNIAGSAVEIQYTVRIDTDAAGTVTVTAQATRGGEVLSDPATVSLGVLTFDTDVPATTEGCCRTVASAADGRGRGHEIWFLALALGAVVLGRRRGGD